VLESRFPERNSGTALCRGRYVLGLEKSEEITMRYAIAFTALTALALSAPAGAQTQKSTQGKFCLTSGSGMADCKYQTMAACEKAKTGSGDKCMSNSMTTGAGSGGMKEKSKQQ
jgi:uncharacterized membrane protein (DUF4010 family)